jgi:starch phosphorylase
MWHPLYPDAASDEDVPIGHITNGVHVPTWMADPMRELLARHLGADWDTRADDPTTWDGVETIPDAELWDVRNRLRADLVAYVRERGALDRLSRGEPSDRVQEFQDAFVPDALTLVFARRVATYKRLYLLGRDPERAVKLLGGDRPVQMVLAGKAHPQDSGAKVTLRGVLDFRGDLPPEVAARVAYLEDYDMRMASRLASGCDVWVNLPRPPLEASGTSGMKAALNGAINLSVPDGWWEEAHDGSNGWIIVGDAWGNAEEQDANDARAFLDLLEREVVPLFHDRDESGVPRGWVRMAKASLRTAGARFGAGRMMDDYLQRYYRTIPVPAS